MPEPRPHADVGREALVNSGVYNAWMGAYFLRARGRSRDLRLQRHRRRIGLDRADPVRHLPGADGAVLRGPRDTGTISPLGAREAPDHHHAWQFPVSAPPDTGFSHIPQARSAGSSQPDRNAYVARLLRVGPVAQWLEPAAHNGLVAGSSPAGPTSPLAGAICIKQFGTEAAKVWERLFAKRSGRCFQRERTKYVIQVCANNLGGQDLTQPNVLTCGRVVQ